MLYLIFIKYIFLHLDLIAILVSLLGRVIFFEKYTEIYHFRFSPFYCASCFLPTQIFVKTLGIALCVSGLSDTPRPVRYIKNNY